VRGHYDDVWRVVHRIVRREEDVEEVVGQVFLSARAALDVDRGDLPLAVRLRRLAVAHAVRAVKPGRSRRKKLEESATPDRQLIEASLTSLDGAQRAPLALRLEGLDYAEIARDLGVPSSTIQHRLSIAREYLSRALRGGSAADGA
jgi:RNA polymerase sigma-70 factor (ECF subfamily)